MTKQELITYITNLDIKDVKGFSMVLLIMMINKLQQVLQCRGDAIW